MLHWPMPGLQLQMDAVAFGDLYPRGYPATTASSRWPGTGLQLLFPLWQIPTLTSSQLQMIDGGLKAAITCLDPSVMPEHLAGYQFGPELLEQLPGSVDPCGENGEFHHLCLGWPHV